MPDILFFTFALLTLSRLGLSCTEQKKRAREAKMIRDRAEVASASAYDAKFVEEVKKHLMWLQEADNFTAISEHYTTAHF